MKLPVNGGERVGWEYHTISLSRVPVYGFGIAVSGGRDNPHFMNGDPSIAISDVLKAGPAEGKLMVNDRVISANGVSLENVDYNQAISVLRECGNTVNLLIKRRALVTHAIANPSIESNNNSIKVALTKASKKDDFGIVLGCKIYVKEITSRININDKDATLQEGDIIHKINNTNVEGLTLKEAKKLLESCKEKVSLIVGRESSFLPNLTINNRFLSENGNYINGHNRSFNGSINAFPPTIQQPPHQRWPSTATEQISVVNGNGKVDIEPLNSNNEPNNLSANIALMANGRPINGWNNQNLYVQPPTRAEMQQLNGNLSPMNDSKEANESNSTIGSKTRGPILDISLNQLDQQKTSSLSASPQKHNGTESSPARPLPQRPIHIESNCKVAQEDDAMVEQETKPTNAISLTSEVRYISFHKEGSVGIRLTGGNEVGIFVTAVQPGSPASIQGLQVGDKILKANGTEMKGFTREEAVLYLLRIQDKIELVVQNCKSEYESIVANQKGDSFFIRVHFNYDSEGKGELSFHVGDIFHVVDTLFNGVVGSWFVYRLGRNNQEIQKGSIPNQSRAQELAAEQKTESRSKKSLSGNDLNATDCGSSRRGNFFKRRRSARRSKSLSKDHWDDVVFGDGSSKFSAYERVTLKHPGFIRPVVFFGPLADIARDKFLREYPDKYDSPQLLNMSEDETPSKSSKIASSSGIVRLSSIKEIVDKNKHVLLDITPSAIDRLNYAQFYPIVIFMRAENKSIVKELRNRSSNKSTLHRSSRKLFEQSIKLDKLWHHIFTASVTLTSGGDLWYKKLRETIEKQQSNTIWVSETKPVENISDDFLFPMISRLSYASSPESDLDISANDSRLDDEDDTAKETRYATSATTGRLVKSSSDPSLAHADEPRDRTCTTEPKAAPSNMVGHVDERKLPQSGRQIVDTSKQRTPNKQLPLHILLRKELSKALNYDSKNKSNTQDETNAQEDNDDVLTQNPPINDPSNYPTLRACDKYPQGSYSSSPKKVESARVESPLPPPPPSTLPPSVYSTATKVQQQYVESPPRIDRNSKPSRFRSAHERLFGSNPISFGVPPTSSLGNQHNDDSDYINTSSPVKYEDSCTSNIQPTTNGQSRYVTGAFGDTSSYSSDSYNKYGSVNSTLEASRSAATTTAEGIRRRQGHTLSYSLTSTLSSKQSSLERNKTLPPPSTVNHSFKLENQTSITSTFSKAPPSPPPKPNSKFGGPSLQYQMNTMTLNDTRPPPPPKPLTMPLPPPPPSLANMHYKQSDYDNMPALCVVNKRQLPTFKTLDISNGPPGYYQSLPQSSYGYHSKDSVARYSSTAETISNFINGTSINNDEQAPFTSHSSLRRPSSNYLEMNVSSVPYYNKPPITPGRSPSKMNYSSNYEDMRYNGVYPPPVSFGGTQSSQQTAVYNNEQYHNNVPYQSKSPYNQIIGSGTSNAYSIGSENQNESSPLPPPPPLPSYSNGNQETSSSQPHTGQYLDLSLNRENRGSAFEAYRKPNSIDAMHPSPIHSENAMFQGLPPPPPPLAVIDYNYSNFSNIDEMTSSVPNKLIPNDHDSGGGGDDNGGGFGGGACSDGAGGNAGENAYPMHNIVAMKRGLFGSEGGSLESTKTGVSIMIPPGAISDGITQEIYFKVCKDRDIAPPLDSDKGETLLSPIVMCGPRGLRFNIPIELRLPHCAMVNPDSWSFALKASETNNGEPAKWRNVTFDESNGIAGNQFNQQFVSVFVDHF